MVARAARRLQIAQTAPTSCFSQLHRLTLPDTPADLHTPLGVPDLSICEEGAKFSGDRADWKLWVAYVDFAD